MQNSSPKTQTRRKRRKLKKGVRRGCLVTVLALCLVVTWGLWHCSPAGSKGKAVHSLHDDMAERAITVSDSLMGRRLDSLMHTALRVDTSQVCIQVVNLQNRQSVYALRPTKWMNAASCMKLLTAITAMNTLGVNHSYQSRWLTHGTLSGGTLYGSLIVSMDDDPLIESFQPFAKALAAQGIRHIEGDLVMDLIRTDTLRPHPTAAVWDIPYNRVPLLMKGRPRIENEVRQTLRQAGITLSHNPQFSALESRRIGPEENGIRRSLALKGMISRSLTVHEETHSLLDVMAPMLIHSSNVKAECLFYHTLHATDRWALGELPPQQAVNNFLTHEMPQAHTDGLVINDGSGLSPDNRLSALLLTQLLTYAYDHPSMREALIGYALATPADPARCGSLQGRLTSLRGRLFCKTGTMTTRGVSSLSGYIQADNDCWYAFSILCGNSPVYESRALQDKLCRLIATAPPGT